MTDPIEIENQLIERIAEFQRDPLGYIEFAFPWGEEGGPLAKDSLRQWQKDACGEIKAAMELGASAREALVPVLMATASGHGSGKVSGCSLIIETPAGQRRWGDIRPGDYVFGKSGAPTLVRQIHPHPKMPIYRITFDDGSSATCGEDHLWDVRGRQERRTKKDTWRTLSTKEIIKLGVKRPNGTAQARQWEIPIQGAAQWPVAKQALHPYVVGLWIGDGTKGLPTWTKNFNELRGKVRDLGYELSVSDDGKTNRILGHAEKFKSGVFSEGSHERFIPHEYKYASVEQRTHLLSGLLDSDGEATSAGTIGYSTTSRRLIDDIIWLARSLGGKAQLQPTTKEPWYPKNGEQVQGRDCYRCTINLPWNPFTLKHRKDAYKPSEHRYLARWIDSIEYSHDEEAMCITVAAADQLYLCSDFIVTHNSAYVSMMLMWAISTCENTRGVVTANTEKQLLTKTWPELTKWHGMAINGHWFECAATSIHAKASPKNWRIDAIPWSEHNLEAFAGLHNKGSRIILIFDEASAISDKVWEVAEGALTDSDTEIIWLVYGNPTRNGGRFRECFRKFGHRWKHRQIDCRDVPGVNLIQIKKWEEDYGLDSDFFKVRVRGMFPSSSFKQYIGTDDADAAFGRNLRVENYNFAPVIITCDPSWSGDDPLVIGRRQGLMFKILRSIPKNDNDVQVATLLAAICDEEQADAVFIDAGYGTGIYSAGITMGRTNWRLVWFGEKAPDPGFLNMRAWMWGQAKKWLKDGGAIPPDHELLDELTGPETVARMDGKIQIESKQDMKARGLPSPNRADCLCLSFAFPVQKTTRMSPGAPTPTAIMATKSTYSPLRRR